MNEYEPVLMESVARPLVNATTFRAYLPDLKSGKFKNLASRSAIEHQTRIFRDVPKVAQTFGEWKKKQNEPFKGITADGRYCSIQPLF
jgi:hypothetical protein